MDRFLSPDSKFSAAMMMAADLVILNVLAVVCSLPIISVGAVQRSLSRVTQEMAKDNAVRPVRDFFAAATRFPGRMVAWSCAMVAFVLLATYEFIVIARAGLSTGESVALSAAVLSGVVLVTAVALWYLRELSLPNAVGNAIRQLPKTLLAVLAHTWWVLILLFLPGQWGAVLAFQLIVGFALSAYLTNLILR